MLKRLFMIRKKNAKVLALLKFDNFIKKCSIVLQGVDKNTN